MKDFNFPQVERVSVGGVSLSELFRKYPDHFERYLFASSYCKGKSVLDVACGEGLGAYLLKKNGAFSVIGLDICANSISKAQDAFGADCAFFQVGSFWQQIPDESIDVLVSMETIEHVRDVQLFLRESLRVLKSGGQVIISTPINESESRFSPQNPFHVREYSNNEFSCLLSEYYLIEDTYSQRSKLAKIASVANKSIMLKFLKNIVPKFLKNTILDYFRKTNLKEGEVSRGIADNAAVQILICKKQA